MAYPPNPGAFPQWLLDADLTIRVKPFPSDLENLNSSLQRGEGSGPQGPLGFQRIRPPY